VPKQYIIKNIYIDDVTDALLKSMKGSKSAHVRSAIRIYGDNKFSVMSITCNSNNRKLVFIGQLSNFYKEDYKILYMHTDNRISIDLNTYGFGCFTLSLEGIFNDTIKALNYKDYLINKYLDDGIVLYNDEIYHNTPRLLVIPIDHILYNKLINYCIINNKSVHKIINKLIIKFVNWFDKG